MPTLIQTDQDDVPDEDLDEQLGRRREAALRLPPMACGCRDPEAPDHLAGHCRYRSVA